MRVHVLVYVVKSFWMRVLFYGCMMMIFMCGPVDAIFKYYECMIRSMDED